MGLLTSDIKEFVRQTKLGFVATVCPDGTPNLSPKGTTIAWDEDHLLFADIHSPGTVENLLKNPAVEVNVVDVFKRKGYRLKGIAEVLSEGRLFDEIISFYRSAGSQYEINHIVLIKVDKVFPVFSPAYDGGLSEEEIIKRWTDYWGAIYKSV